jgi:hypothetical protein
VRVRSLEQLNKFLHQSLRDDLFIKQSKRPIERQILLKSRFKGLVIVWGPETEDSRDLGVVNRITRIDGVCQLRNERKLNVRFAFAVWYLVQPLTMLDERGVGYLTGSQLMLVLRACQEE